MTAIGCWGAPRPMTPLASEHYPNAKSSLATAILFMPGRRSRGDDFESNGFIKAVQEHGLDVELVAVDAHLGYYLDGGYRLLPTRIHEDVVQPLMAHGRRRIWLVGTSLGAFGSLAYAKQFPEAVAGVILFGPYLGEEPIMVAIERAGGLAAWSPIGSAGYDYEIRTWSWLKGFADPGTRRPFELFLAYGQHDSYYRTSKILADVLPRDHVIVDEEGGHDWDTWLALWKRFLACCGRQLVTPTGE